MARGVIVIVGLMTVTIVILMSEGVKGDVSQDTAECADQLSSMATCLQYVQGQAKAPTPDCCSGLKQVLSSSKKCLCVIVKDGNDPQLGLNINVNLALGLPSVCHASANVTQCPALLHLDPNSPEAQVFYEFGKTSSSPTASSPAPALGPVAGGSTNSTASAPQTSNAKAFRAASGWSLLALFWLFIMCSNLLT